MTANLVRRARQFFTAHGGRLAKYLTGSVIAGIIAMATVALTFGSALLGSKGAALAGSTTGAIANYFLNRRWTWGRRGRADFRKELVPYWITVVVTAFIAAVVTGAANAVVREITPDRGVRAVTNALAFQAVYGVSFIVKYHIFHRLFHERDPAPLDGSTHDAHSVVDDRADLDADAAAAPGKVVGARLDRPLEPVAQTFAARPHAPAISGRDEGARLVSGGRGDGSTGCSVAGRHDDTPGIT